MFAWIQAHGGFGAVALIALGLYNVTLSGIGQIFTILHAQEPGWIQKLATYGLTAQQWLAGTAGASVVTPQVKVASPAPTSSTGT